jgi:MoaA/NifB/PqqE/SkfB family radical SAM enzyme
VHRVLLSVDGVTKAMFESIRVGANFERVIGHIKALSQLRKRYGLKEPELVIDFVMMQRNIHHAPAMVRAAKLLGIDTLDFRHMVPGDTATDVSGEALVLKPALFNHYRKKVLAEAEATGIRVYIPDLLPVATESDPIVEPLEPSLDEIAAVPTDIAPDEAIDVPAKSVATDDRYTVPRMSKVFADTFCPRPFSEIMIRNQNEVLPCAWHTEVLGRLSDGQDLLSIFTGPKFRELRKAMMTPQGAHGCRNCPLKKDLLPQTLREFSS